MIKTEEELIWESYEKSLITEDILGEYWIDDSGNSIYADGDNGGVNHEMVVSMNIMAELLSYFDIEFDIERPTTVFSFLSDEDDDKIFEKLKEEGFIEDGNERDMYEVFMDDKYELIEKYLKTMSIKNLESKLLIAHNEMDAREYALKYDNWKRVKGNWIETWYLRSQDLNIITSGISDILKQESNKSEKETFNIEVRSIRKIFEDIPIDVLLKNKIKLLLPYRQSY